MLSPTIARAHTKLNNARHDGRKHRVNGKHLFTAVQRTSQRRESGSEREREKEKWATNGRTICGGKKVEVVVAAEENNGGSKERVKVDEVFIRSNSISNHDAVWS